MIQQDFYTGEPVNPGSPNNFQNPNIINTGPTAESEAASMASFGKYDYDPSMRQATAAMPVQLTGGFGGTFNPYPNGGGIGAPPPPQFGGIPPYGYSPYGYYTGYGYYNQQPTYNYYRPYPTGGQIPFPPQQPCQTFQQPTTCHIPGVNFSGEYLPPADYEQRITEMQMEYFSRQQELEAKQEVDRQSSVYGYGNMYGYNYYGIPYYNPYQYNALNNEFQSRIKAMQDEARENRLKFNLNISKLAHNFAGHNISDEDIRERYTGRTIDIPQAYIQPPEEYMEQMRFRNMVPFDNSQAYRDHRAQIQREYSAVIPPDANLKEAFDGMGIIAANWEMEEEMHRRRNAGVLYNSGDNSYKYFVRQKAAERYAQEKGIVPMGQLMPAFSSQSVQQSYVSSNPVLSKVANLTDDGTLNVSLNIPCNVGSHKGENYTVHNSQEAEYEEKKERFGRFLASEPGNSYLDQLKQQKLERYSNG